MIARLGVFILILAIPALSSAADCSATQHPRGPQHIGPWINHGNWLDPENVRIGLRSADVFMPSVSMLTPAKPVSWSTANRPLNLDRIKVIDPADGEERDLAYILGRQLNADALLVTQNNTILAEHYWHGYPRHEPRILSAASRAVASLLGVMGITQGKLVQDRSATRYLPVLASNTGLRKLSIQRLLEGNAPHTWSPDELAEWQSESGWNPGRPGGDIRHWLSQPGRWDRELSDSGAPFHRTPDEDLLLWIIANSFGTATSQVMCDHLLTRLRPENPVKWFGDTQGTELAGGLALSLRDYSRFGKLLVEARDNPNRSKIPAWFLETLLAKSGTRRNALNTISGLAEGSELRYGFLHLGGEPNRLAIIGDYGNSLFIDFERRLVITLFAAYPTANRERMRATLEAVWGGLSSAAPPLRKH